MLACTCAARAWNTSHCRSSLSSLAVEHQRVVEAFAVGFALGTEPDARDAQRLPALDARRNGWVTAVRATGQDHQLPRRGALADPACGVVGHGFVPDHLRRVEVVQIHAVTMG